MDTALYIPPALTPRPRQPVQRLGWLPGDDAPDPFGLSDAWQKGLARAGVSLVPLRPRAGTSGWAGGLWRPGLLRGLPRSRWPWLGVARDLAKQLREMDIDRLLLGVDARSVWLGQVLRRELGLSCLWWLRDAPGAPVAMTEGDRVVCDSLHARAHWLASGGARVPTLLAPGIDLMRHDWQPPRARDGAFKLVVIGAQSPAGGYGILLEAMAMLVKNGYPVLALLVGEGGFADTLQQQGTALGLAGRIEWLPLSGISRLRARLREADALVVPSLLPAADEALLIGMAQGLPCVATRVGAVPERLREGVDGLLVPPADADALARAISRLVDSPEFGLALSCTARRRVEERHESGAIAVQWAAWLAGGPPD